jgi:hypothetical protein
MINRFTYDSKKEDELKKLNDKEKVVSEESISDYKSFFPLFKLKIEENLHEIMSSHYGTYVAHTILEVSILVVYLY